VARGTSVEPLALRLMKAGKHLCSGRGRTCAPGPLATEAQQGNVGAEEYVNRRAGRMSSCGSTTGRLMLLMTRPATGSSSGFCARGTSRWWPRTSLANWAWRRTSSATVLRPSRSFTPCRPGSDVSPGRQSPHLTAAVTATTATTAYRERPRTASDLGGDIASRGVVPPCKQTVACRIALMLIKVSQPPASARLSLYGVGAGPSRRRSCGSRNPHTTLRGACLSLTCLRERRHRPGPPCWLGKKPVRTPQVCRSATSAQPGVDRWPLRCRTTPCVPAGCGRSCAPGRIALCHRGEPQPVPVLGPTPPPSSHPGHQARTIRTVCRAIAFDTGELQQLRRAARGLAAREAT
jgi:hypothetical protein